MFEQPLSGRVCFQAMGDKCRYQGFASGPHLTIIAYVGNPQQAAGCDGGGGTITIRRFAGWQVQIPQGDFVIGQFGKEVNGRLLGRLSKLWFIAPLRR